MSGLFRQGGRKKEDNFYGVALFVVFWFSRHAQECANKVGFSCDEGVCECFIGVGVVFVAGFEDGVAAQVLDGAGYAGEEKEGEPLPLEEIMQMLLDAFDAADTNADGKLSYEEALAIITGLTQDQFNALDANADSFLSLEELGGEGGCGCCKSTGDAKINIKRYIGDWLLVGLSLLVLISLANRQKR